MTRSLFSGVPGSVLSFNSSNLLPTLTALENVALPFVLDGRSKEEAEQRAAMLLDKVGLQNRQDHLPEEMSGGEIQRIAVARALAFDPPILLADEPTGNLDSKTGESILSLLRQINREAGCTIVMVTHSQEAARYGGRTIFFATAKSRRTARDAASAPNPLLASCATPSPEDSAYFPGHYSRSRSDRRHRGR